jgi:DNA-binding CsgD family transcriptional regulator
MECIAGGAAVLGRIGQGTDGLEELDDRAGPAMRHDQRQRVLMPGPDVDEVDLHPVDLCRELRQCVQSRLGLAPVVLGAPVAGELFERRELHALRPIPDEFLGGPAGGRDPAAQLDDLLVGDGYASLTPREREVMSWVVSGLLNKQVGGELGISEITVKAHRGQVMRKMRPAALRAGQSAASARTTCKLRITARDEPGGRLFCLPLP